jgi:hypothetical protein
MSERRKRTRVEEKHPLAKQAKLRPAGPALDRRAAKRSKPQQPAVPLERERITVQLSAEVVDRLRNAVYWSEGVTLAGFIENCIVRSVEDMERKRGSSFPPRREELKRGRPSRN